MKLSIIIVNYNVKFYLEQCLLSCYKAIRSTAGLHEQNAEVLVLDNASTDGSIEYLEPLFPLARFFRNTENIGFSRANNQALRESSGEYVLFLNPDTILSESSLGKCIGLMEDIEQAGAIGVKMIDGTGCFLPESKRGLPTPWRAFCKFSGLCSLFPTSRVFAGYYLGHLDPERTQAVEVLSGAFLFCRKTCLTVTGGFDESFFMYAEDIDLCGRMQEAGFYNYYLPETSIIHFKGESTRKDFRYLKLFYGAMSLYIRKHSRSFASRAFGLLLNMGIFIRLQLAKMRLYFHSAEKTRPKKIRSFLFGNPEKYMADAVSADPWRVREMDLLLADEIIFCEGKDLCFEQIIQTMEKEKQKYFYKIHAEGSHSLIGSDSRTSMGSSWSVKST